MKTTSIPRNMNAYVEYCNGVCAKQISADLNVSKGRFYKIIEECVELIESESRRQALKRKFNKHGN